MNIAICLIATGKYIDFVPPLLKGLFQYLLPNHKRWIYVFTDSEKPIKGVEMVYTEHKPFPHPTLYRYHIIYNYFHSQQLNFDYYYYLDSDSLIVNTVGDEILGKLVLTQHPGFYHKRPTTYTFDRKFLSMAYVNPFGIKKYFAGGFNGGSEYLKMAKTIMKWVDIDAKYGYVPCWHDESYLQKYAKLHPPDVILNPKYLYPQTDHEIITYGLQDLSPKIICINKSHASVLQNT
jgi:histo-blood group ABO system transferase